MDASVWEFSSLPTLFEILSSAESKYVGIEYLQLCSQDSIDHYVNEAATKIQAVHRGAKGRKLHAQKKKEKKEHLSAVKIQKTYRGKRGRDEVKRMTSNTGHLMVADEDEAYAMMAMNDRSSPKAKARQSDGGKGKPPANTDVQSEVKVEAKVDVRAEGAGTPRRGSQNGGHASASVSPARMHSPSTPKEALERAQECRAVAGAGRNAASFIRNDCSNVLIADEDLRQLFDYYDTNGNGWLSKEEVKQIYAGFENFGLDDGPNKVDEIISKYSMLGDDKVTFDEFCILMLSIAQR